MAKRTTGVGKSKKTRSHKTAKRLAIKKERLEALAAKRAPKKRVTATKAKKTTTKTETKKTSAAAK